MNTVNIDDAAFDLSKLIAQVESGEEITICRFGRPIAKLVPSGFGDDRVPGIAKGRLTDDFFDELPKEELEALH